MQLLEPDIDVLANVVLSAITVAGTTAKTTRNNKSRAKIKKRKGEHENHPLRRRFSIIFSFPIVQSSRRSPMLGREN